MIYWVLSHLFLRKELFSKEKLRGQITLVLMTSFQKDESAYKSNRDMLFSYEVSKDNRFNKSANNRTLNYVLHTNKDA